MRIGYGLVPILAGADKFTNLLADWDRYLSPHATRRLPMKRRTFMRIVGCIEMAAGALVFSKRSREGAYVVAGWLTAIAANLVLDRRYDIAVRDLSMALGAFTLAKLIEARTPEVKPALPREPPRREPFFPSTPEAYA